ncbi:MAG TPA: carbohydrate-binding protein, partial [Bacillaceae bacterium]|nr:carbohydrate-binding protein [Bacillaceae bacterium]
IMVDGSELGWETSELPDEFNYEALHTIRVEKKESEVKVFVDGMHKQTRNVESLAGGAIGYTTNNVQAEFGYIATSNHVDGSNIFEVHKPLPGSVEAVHYSNYHAVGEVNDTYRKDEVDIRPNSEGGYSAHLAEQEWLEYNVNIESDSTYSFNVRVAAEANAKIRILLDGETDLTGAVDVANSGNEWRNLTLNNISLAEGKHTLKVEVISGEVNFAKLDVNKYEDAPIYFEDFNSGVAEGWQQFEGSWRVDTGNINTDVFDGYKPIPGNVQAAYYITGGEGVAYHDTTPQNIGGERRDDAVDIRTKPGGGTAVGWNQTGEWLKYNVDIKSAGLYDLKMEYGTTFTSGKVRFWLDDEIDLTGVVDVPSTGDWNNWRELTIKDVELPEGKHTLKVEIVEGEYDIAKFNFSSNSIYQPIPGSFASNATLAQGETHTVKVKPEEAGVYDLDFIGKNTTTNTQVKFILNNDVVLGEYSLTDPITLELPAGEQELSLEIVSGELSFTTLHFHTFAEAHALPGKIMAVDYMLGGEGVAYHDKTVANIGGQYRFDTVDIRNHPDGSFNIGWNQPGEWYKYKVDIATSGNYVMEMAVATTIPGTQVRVWLDDEVDLTGIITVPQTGNWDNWVSFIKDGITLPAGEHTIKVETISGEFDFHHISFHDASDYEIVEQEGTLRSGAGTYGKMTYGDSAWHDYIVEADLQVVDGNGDGGILFRVQNPVDGKELNHNSADMLQGYVAFINQGGVHLGKFNYNWQYITGASLDVPIDEFQHVKVVAEGTNIKVYVDDMETPKIDYTDNSANAYTHGKIGVRSFLSDTKYDNIYMRPLDPTVDSVRELIDYFYEEDEIEHSLYQLVQNKLRQAEHHNSKGRGDMAAKFLSDIISHLEKQSSKITDRASEKIKVMIEDLK